LALKAKAGQQSCNRWAQQHQKQKGAEPEHPGLILYFKLGKAVRFRAGDVAAVLERMRVG
jgi:hypothetical protein